MVMSKKKSRFLAILTVICLMMALSTQMVFATNSLNGVGENNTTVTENVTANQSAPVGDTTTSQPTTNQGQVNNAQTNTQTNQNIAGLPETTQNPQDIENTANAVSGMFGQAGPDAEDIAMANAFIEPIANIMNKVMAVILGMTSLLMMFTTMLDLLYLAFPPVRDYLDGGRQGMSNMMAGGRGGMGRGMGGMRGGMGGMRGGYGMGGMGGMNSMGGMGMGGIGGMGSMGGMGGMGGMQQGMGQPVGGGLSAVGRWVSDEAVSACNECMGGGMEGQMGMQGSVKSMVFSYIKKRSLFLILFGVCVVLFSSTVFFDLGARLGTWILKIIMGFGI